MRVLSFRLRIIWTIVLTLGAFFVVSQVPATADSHLTLLTGYTTFAAPTTIGASHGNNWNAQSFQISEDNTPTIAFLRMNKTGSPSGNATLSIQTVLSNGSTDVCSGDRDVSTISTNNFYSFTLENCPQLDANTTFFLVLRCSTCADSSNHISWLGRAVNEYDLGMRHTSTNGGDSWTDNTGLDLNFELYADSTPPPTPTPVPTILPTPTSTPHARTPVIIADSDIEIITDCLATYHPDFPTIGRLFIQPFDADITAQVSSVDLRLSRVGVPSTQLLVSLVTMPESGTPTIDDVQILATGSISASSLGVNATTRNIAFSPNPAVLIGQRYGLLIGAFTGISNHYCVWGDADTSEDFYESNDEGSSWFLGPEQYDSFTAKYQVNGFTFESGYFPPNPAQNEPAPSPPSAYEDYIWSWTNQYVNAPLAYEFATVTVDSTFIVRRLNENGNPIQNLGSYTVTSATPFFVHETVNQSPGPFDVFDSTNNRRLVKHYLLPEPPNAFKDNRPHRADADFAIGHGDIVYRTPATSTGRQHNAANPLLSIQRFGTYTFLHYRIPDLEDPEDVFLSVRDANSLAERIRVSIADLALYNNWDNGGSVANFNDSIYFQNFVVLNTDGNNLPFVQNFDLLSIVGATLEQGTYNYALVDEDNVVLSEGESILIVLNDPLNPWALSANKSRYVLGETARYTFTQRFEILFSVWNNFIFESCCGEIPDLVGETYQQTQTLSFTHPETWPNPLPATILTFIRVAPSSLPYTSNPTVYAFNYNVFYELLASCGVQCRIDSAIPKDDRFLLSIFLLIALGITAVKIPVPIVGLFEGFLFVALAVMQWIPREYTLLTIIVLSLVVVIVFFLRRGGQGDM